MEFAIVKGENILSEFVIINMHCRISVSEYQIEGTISVIFFSCAARATCGQSCDCNRSRSQELNLIRYIFAMKLILFKRQLQYQRKKQPLSSLTIIK